jgi:D-cysteine desulfhydrase family pyridoxal phosphate-dependent enzyme
MDLSRFPRELLCHLPTPLERLPRLSAHLGGADVWVKRDDATGLALGGNKARKLEFLLGHARAAGADTLITCGAPQSNHCRMTAAAAARAGMACILVLQDRVAHPDRALYMSSGNVLLDRLTGARLHIVGADADMEAELARVADEVRAGGGRPYVIPLGGSNPIGVLGYVDAAVELERQAAEAGLVIDALAVAAGSGGTQAGLVAGMGERARVIGICIGDPPDAMRSAVEGLTAGVSDLLGIDAPGADRIDIRGGFIGPRYGEPTPEMVEAVRLCAELEGLILDPVYTGKAMAGLIASIRSGELGPGRNVVFMHTGGTPSLFVYHAAFPDDGLSAA